MEKCGGLDADPRWGKPRSGEEFPELGCSWQFIGVMQE